MTDANAPTPDPTEDRVRRTFATRAEDMAPGDSAGDLPDLGGAGRVAPRRLRGTRRPALAAAAVLVVVASTAGAALVARNSDSDAGVDTVAERPNGESDVAAITAPRRVVEALRNERSLAAITLMGYEEAIAPPVDDATQARSDTDAAVASFATFVAASPGGSAYLPGLDALDALAELRRDVDADAGPRDMSNHVTAQDVFDRYTGLVGGLLDDQQAYAETIDDPVVRTGAVAYARGMRLHEQTTQLQRASLLAVILADPSADPGTVAELAQLRTDVQLGLEALESETAGTPFEEAAVAAVGAVGEAGVLDTAARVMEGPVDVPGILDASALLEEEAWPAFLDSVAETLEAQT